MADTASAVVHLAYCEVEQEDGGTCPMWNAEVLLDGDHVSSHGGQDVDAVLGGAADVLRRRVEPVEPRAGILSSRGFDTVTMATAALREAAGVES